MRSNLLQGSITHRTGRTRQVPVWHRSNCRNPSIPTDRTLPDHLRRMLYLRRTSHHDRPFNSGQSYRLRRVAMATSLRRDVDKATGNCNDPYPKVKMVQALKRLVLNLNYSAAPSELTLVKRDIVCYNIIVVACFLVKHQSYYLACFV